MVSRPRRRGKSPLTHSHTPPLDERASFHGHSDDDAGEGNQEGEDEDEAEGEHEEPPPQPLPLPNPLRRQPSITMPGALFPRSPSIDPTPPQPVALYVHFPTKPTYLTMRCLWLAHRALRNARRPLHRFPIDHVRNQLVNCLGGAANGLQVAAIP
ncbi:hypothetical protein BGW80DRAFT_858209 [Lactifluus volemus]|nr:hypothetical protein BGW80DRAFT_858209 [Lactifluus volemus]